MLVSLHPSSLSPEVVFIVHWLTWKTDKNTKKFAPKAAQRKKTVPSSNSQASADVAPKPGTPALPPSPSLQQPPSTTPQRNQSTPIPTSTVDETNLSRPSTVLATRIPSVRPSSAEQSEPQKSSTVSALSNEAPPVLVAVPQATSSSAPSSRPPVVQATGGPPAAQGAGRPPVVQATSGPHVVQTTGTDGAPIVQATNTLLSVQSPVGAPDNGAGPGTVEDEEHALQNQPSKPSTSQPVSTKRVTRRKNPVQQKTVKAANQKNGHLDGEVQGVVSEETDGGTGEDDDVEDGDDDQDESYEGRTTRAGRKAKQTPAASAESKGSARGNAKAKAPARPRAPRKRKGAAAEGNTEAEDETDAAAAAAAAPVPAKTRAPRKRSAAAVTGDSAEAESGEGKEGAAKAKKPRAPRKPKVPAEKAAQSDSNNADAESESGPKARRGRKREVTPENSEEIQIEPAITKLSDLTRDTKIGRKSDRFKELEKLDWTEVVRKQRARKAALEARKAAGEEIPPPETTEQRLERLANENRTAAAAAAAAARHYPQVRLLNGQVVVDEESLNVDRRALAAQQEAPLEEVEESALTRRVNGNTWSKREKPERWDGEADAKFYQGLSMFGTDFELIAGMFPDRSRRQIKNRYNNEERKNPDKITNALKRRITPSKIFPIPFYCCCVC